MHKTKAHYLHCALIALTLSFVWVEKAGAADDIPGFSPSPYPPASIMNDPTKPIVVYPRQRSTGNLSAEEASQGPADRLLEKARRLGRLRIIVGIDYPEPSSTTSTAEMGSHASGLRVAQDAVLKRIGLTDAAGNLTAQSAASVKRFSMVPGFALDVSPAVLQLLLTDPDVVSIEEDILLFPSLKQSVPLIGGAALQTMGLTGQGYTVAILDTGTDTKYEKKSNTFIHPMLAAKIKAVGCYSEAHFPLVKSLCPGGVDEWTGKFAGANCPLSLDGCDHGTHVAGIAIGNMTSLKGVASGAGLVSIQVYSKNYDPFDCGLLSTPCISAQGSDVIKGLERVKSLQSTYNIVAVNLSLGSKAVYGTACDSVTPMYTAAISMVRAAGIAPVVASGNEGANGSISFPACISTAIAVGSTTKIAPEVVSSFSNHSEQVRLLAPGSNIVSARANGQGKSATIAMSGTSMAAPHVAGAFALLKQAKPSATVEDILNALECTGKPISRLGVPKPRINLVAARDFLVAGKPCSFDIVVLDSGSAKDDIFVIKVDGTEICRTPVGGRRECGIKGVGRGSHRLAVFVELAPDNIGTYTVTLGNNIKFSDGTTSKYNQPPQGTTDTYTIIVP